MPEQAIKGVALRNFPLVIEKLLGAAEAARFRHALTPELQHELEHVVSSGWYPLE